MLCCHFNQLCNFQLTEPADFFCVCTFAPVDVHSQTTDAVANSTVNCVERLQTCWLDTAQETLWGYWAANCMTNSTIMKTNVPDCHSCLDCETAIYITWTRDLFCISPTLRSSLLPSSLLSLHISSKRIGNTLVYFLSL